MAEAPTADEGAAPQAHLQPASTTPQEPQSEPDQAWKALGLVNDWVKHADAKVGATLAATGVVAVMLYNLVKAQQSPGVALSVFSVLCAIAVAAAGCSAALALMPRLTIISKLEQCKIARRANKNASGGQSASLVKDPVNVLFFSNIAKHYDKDGPSYIDVLRSLTSNRDQLTRQIAHQVHANATVAHRKFVWADRAIKSLISALLMLSVVAIIIGSKG